MMCLQAKKIRPIWGIATLSMVLVIGSLFYYQQTWGTVANFVEALDHCDVLFCDFTKQYYPTGQQLFESATPTDGYFYSLFFAIFLALLGQFSLETAVLIWTLFQVVMAVLLFILPAYTFWQYSRRAYFLYLVLLLLAVPILHNFKWGQISTFVTASVLATYYFYSKEQKFLAVILLALATAAKFYPGLFLIYFLFKKEWRFILSYLIVVAVFVVLVPLLVLGLDNNLHFYQIVNERIAHARSSWVLTDINSQYLANVAGRLTSNQDNRMVWQIIGYGLTALGLAQVYQIAQITKPISILWAFALLFLLTPFFVETSWPHYFVYLPFCQVLVFLQLEKEPRKSLAWFIAALLLALSMLLLSLFFFNLISDWKIYSRYGILFWANLLVLLPAISLSRISSRALEGESWGEGDTYRKKLTVRLIQGE